MNPSTLANQPDLTPLFVLWGVFFVVGIGVYLWYAFMLSKVFTRLGTESWKAWVPVLNEAEILRLGGVPSWSVVFYFVPILQYYGLYLKAIATSRLNAHFGRGAGSTALAILLPPVWATLLARGAGVADPALQERIAPSVAPRSGYAFAVSTPQAPEPLPPVPAAATPPPLVAPPAPPAPPAFPTFPPAAPPAPPAPPASLAPPAPPAAPAAATPPPAPPAGLLPPPPPLGSGMGATPPPPAGLIVPPPGIITPPPGLTPPPAAPPAAAPPAAAPPAAPAEPPAQPWVSFDRPPIVPPAVVPPAVVPPAVVPAAPDDDALSDELDRTVVVDRRPVVPWRLLVDGGSAFRLTGTRIVLGRRPDGAGAGAQEIAVPDSTRTLSKVHARLELADGVWTVTDLNATNGVIVIEADGTENLLDPGASAPVSERFVLGKVGMRLAFGEEDATP